MGTQPIHAAVLHEIGATPRYESFPAPEAGDEEAVVTVTAAALKPSDRLMAAGVHYAPTAFPQVVGLDGVGRLQDGTRVAFFLPQRPHGGMAERTLVRRGAWLPVPDGVDDVTAAAILNPGGAAWKTVVWEGELAAGQTVLVLGATGTSGRIAAQLAVRHGARVIAAGRNQRVLDGLVARGADAAVRVDRPHDELAAAIAACGPVRPHRRLPVGPARRGGLHRADPWRRRSGADPLHPGRDDRRRDRGAARDGAAQGTRRTWPGAAAAGPPRSRTSRRATPICSGRSSPGRSRSTSRPYRSPTSRRPGRGRRASAASSSCPDVATQTIANAYMICITWFSSEELVMLNSLRSDPTTPERYERIDDVLGHPAHRYLGDGHRGVDQHLHDIRLGVDEFGDHGVRAKASVRYPARWSVKDNPIELGPHLSAIDATILAVTLGECHLVHARGLDPEQRRHAWMRSLELRAGQQPLLDLDEFDVEARVVESRADPLSLCGQVTTLACRIGGIRARCTIEHEPGRVRTDSGSFTTAEELLGDPGTRYYGDSYKRMRRDIEDVRITPGVGFALGMVTVEEPADGRLGDGLGAAYGPVLRPIDGIITAAQLAQAMLYRLDRLDRGYSNTLWMRRVALTSESPHQPLTNPIATTVSTVDTRVTPVRGFPWRTAEMDANMLGWQGSCTLTHVLPFSAEPVRTPRGRGRQATVNPPSTGRIVPVT